MPSRNPDLNDDHACFRCAACDAARSAEHLFYRSLAEQLDETPNGVRDHRLCDLHTRRLTLGDEVLDHTAARILERVLSSASRRRALSRRYGCAVCRAADVAASNATSHATDDVCISHLGDTITDLEARAVGRALRGAVSWRMQRQVLAAPDHGDLAMRVRLRSLVPAQQREREASTALDRLGLRLEIPNCPICVEMSRVEVRWLQFVAAEAGHGRETIAHLCASHLDDLTAASPELGQLLIEQLVATALHDVDRLIAAVRLKSLGALSNERCAICRALGVTADRQVALLRIGLRDERWRAAYEQSGGLCVSHMCGLDLATNRCLTRRLRTRIDSVAQALAGPSDRRSVLRAAALLNGRTFLGATATVLEATESTQPARVQA